MTENPLLFYFIWGFTLGYIVGMVVAIFLLERRENRERERALKKLMDAADKAVKK